MCFPESIGPPIATRTERKCPKPRTPDETIIGQGNPYGKLIFGKNIFNLTKL
jgi:hypothetical protein